MSAEKIIFGSRNFFEGISVLQEFFLEFSGPGIFWREYVFAQGWGAGRIKKKQKQQKAKKKKPEIFSENFGGKTWLL